MSDQPKSNVIPFRRPNKATAKSETYQMNFGGFVHALEERDVAAATNILDGMFQLGAKTALDATLHFQNKMKTEVNFVEKAQGLRKLLMNNQHNEALSLLYDAFGLQGMEALKILSVVMNLTQSNP